MTKSVGDINNKDRESIIDLYSLSRGLVIAYEYWRDESEHLPGHKQIAATSCVFLAARQSDGIRILLENNRVDSAMVLLRPLIETYINCAYLFIVEDKSNMVRFMYTGDKEDLDNTKKYQNFVEKTYTKPKYTKEMFDSLIEKYERGIDETQEIGLPLKKMHDLRTRAQMVMDYTGCPEFGELYYNSYLLLCNNTHASASSLAEISMSPDFESRWYHREELEAVKNILSVCNGILASLPVFLEKNADIKLQTNTFLTSKILKKYNRYIEYEQLKKK